MSFQHNAPPPTEGFSLLPDGPYDFQITDIKEKTTKNGDPMVNVTCEVINSSEYNGKKVFMNVNFLQTGKPGAGMSTHFLKSIGQPWEGAVTVDPDNWVGEQFKARVETREYVKTDKTKGKANDIKDIEEIGQFASPEVAKAAKTDDVPF